MDMRVSCSFKHLRCIVLFFSPVLKTGTGNGSAYSYTPPSNTALYSHTAESVGI